MKYCKDCKFYNNIFKSLWYRTQCRAPGNKANRLNLVTGKTQTEYTTKQCIDLRRSDCGLDARWFESRN